MECPQGHQRCSRKSRSSVQLAPRLNCPAGGTIWHYREARWACKGVYFSESIEPDPQNSQPQEKSKHTIYCGFNLHCVYIKRLNWFDHTPRCFAALPRFHRRSAQGRLHDSVNNCRATSFLLPGILPPRRRGAVGLRRRGRRCQPRKILDGRPGGWRDFGIQYIDLSGQKMTYKHNILWLRVRPNKLPGGLVVGGFWVRALPGQNARAFC